MSDAEDSTTETTDSQYSEVSLRAVELLARAQRTADEAVAEAQAYARDLEASARTQYAQILQRAQVAARDVGSKGTASPDDAAGAAGGSGGGVSPEIVAEVDYVRTYARVAHAQLKTVLDALTDELDRLAELASGATTDAGIPTAMPPLEQTSWPTPPGRVPDVVNGGTKTDAAASASSGDDVADSDSDDGADGSSAGSPRAATGRLWTREDADSDDRALSGARQGGWRGALQRKS